MFLRRLGLLAAVLTLVVPGTTSGFAEETPGITRIEEDWAIDIGEPNSEEEAPQITTVIAPFATLNGPYAVFELNHATLPQYGAGGMQLQLWNGDWALGYRTPDGSRLLNAVNEKVRYTTVMSLRDGRLRFEIRNGTSTTWGDFGAEGQLRIGLFTAMSTLNSYRTATSVQNSRVGFASNRVQKMVLKQVRYYANDLLVATDSTERVVSEPGSTNE